MQPHFYVERVISFSEIFLFLRMVSQLSPAWFISRTSLSKAHYRFQEGSRNGDRDKFDERCCGPVFDVLTIGFCHPENAWE